MNAQQQRGLHHASRCRILELPPELRELIYSFSAPQIRIFDNSLYRSSWHSTTIHSSSSTPRLQPGCEPLLLCKIISAEFRAYVLKHAIFLLYVREPQDVAVPGDSQRFPSDQAGQHDRFTTHSIDHDISHPSLQEIYSSISSVPPALPGLYASLNHGVQRIDIAVRCVFKTMLPLRGMHPESDIEVITGFLSTLKSAKEVVLRVYGPKVLGHDDMLYVHRAAGILKQEATSLEWFAVTYGEARFCRNQDMSVVGGTLYLAGVETKQVHHAILQQRRKHGAWQDVEDPPWWTKDAYCVRRHYTGTGNTLFTYYGADMVQNLYS